MSIVQLPRHRSVHGCWVCKLRRKKCDEKYPECDNCAALEIACHYGREKPDWMDGGERQLQMAEYLKAEVKAKASQRRIDRPFYELRQRDLQNHNEETEEGVIHKPETPTRLLQRSADCSLPSRGPTGGSLPFGRSDTVLFTFYLETLLPFLFPFYNPPPLQGGKSWILEMMISSPVVRHALLCQSSHFFSLTQGAFSDQNESVLLQTKDAFDMLRKALQYLISSGFKGHFHGAVRILASIMHVQRFEAAILNFENSQAHLDAALALFTELNRSVSTSGSAEPFGALIDSLGPTTQISLGQNLEVPSAEQAAFRFSSALLIFDDIVMSTVLRKPPRLYEIHDSMLVDNEGTPPAIKLEDVIGCQNWVLQKIGQIAILDAWKESSMSAENLGTLELAQRAEAIQISIDYQLIQLDREMPKQNQPDRNISTTFITRKCHMPYSTNPSASLITRVWAHAAQLYLFTVAHNWQPAHGDVQNRVGQIIHLLTYEMLDPRFLRTMVWPFCVAGCLAQRHQENDFRKMTNALQPPELFRTSHKALEIMENIWRDREVVNVQDRNLAQCFTNQGEPMLLV